MIVTVYKNYFRIFVENSIVEYLTGDLTEQHHNIVMNNHSINVHHHLILCLLSSRYWQRLFSPFYLHKVNTRLFDFYFSSYQQAESLGPIAHSGLNQAWNQTECHRNCCFKLLTNSNFIRVKP